MDNADLSRVLQGIIAGIGFLGAGAIIKLSEKEEIKGLTTAASIWATAAIGLGAGMGHEITAVLSALLVLAILAGAAADRKANRPAPSHGAARSRRHAAGCNRS